jgi:hypothetical protein
MVLSKDMIERSVLAKARKKGVDEIISKII